MSLAKESNTWLANSKGAKEYAFHPLCIFFQILARELKLCFFKWTFSFSGNTYILLNF